MQSLKKLLVSIMTTADDSVPISVWHPVLFISLTSPDFRNISVAKEYQRGVLVKVLKGKRLSFWGLANRQYVISGLLKIRIMLKG